MTDNIQEKNTEQKILDAATEVFQEKGMYGARMQEIADRAGINKALLHYYYRSKHKLFETVFKMAFKMIAPKIRNIMEADVHFFDKIRMFTNEYINFISKHSYLPAFIIQELNQHPELIQNTIKSEVSGSIDLLRKQVDDLVTKGEIKPIPMEHILVNTLSMSIFPLVAKPILTKVLNKDEAAFKQFIDERRTLVAETVINSIKT
jgi:AcrR family transcriptional regulator